jgi:5-methylcytosine-specific restriction protein A
MPGGGRIYDTARWTAVRIAVLRNEPYCRACRAAGRNVIAYAVDHIVALEEGGDPWSRTNLQPLCRSCHGAKTRAETLGEAKRAQPGRGG